MLIAICIINSDITELFDHFNSHSIVFYMSHDTANRRCVCTAACKDSRSTIPRVNDVHSQSFGGFPF
jgi:hypothetical protein